MPALLGALGGCGGNDAEVSVSGKRTPEPYYREVETWEGPQGWSSWKDASPAIGGLAIERRNGQWLIQDDRVRAGRAIVLPRIRSAAASRPSCSSSAPRAG